MLFSLFALLSLTQGFIDVELDSRNLLILEKPHPICKIISNVAFGPSRVKYTIPPAASNKETECLIPKKPPLNGTEIMEHANRVELTLNQGQVLYESLLLPYTDDLATEMAKIRPISWLSSFQNKLSPGIYTLRAKFYVCAIESQSKLVAPLQYEADLCIEAVDTFRPKATHQCPAPLLGALRKYNTMALFEYGKLDKEQYKSNIAKFNAFSTDVLNGPCTSGNVGTRCDIALEHIKPLSGSFWEQASLSDYPAFFDQVTKEDYDGLKQQIAQADLVNEVKPIEKTECVRCVRRQRDLQELVSGKTCENPTGSEKCLGAPDQRCLLSVCESAKAEDIYSAEIKVSTKYIKLSQKYQKQAKFEAIYVEGEVHLCAGKDHYVHFNVDEMVEIQSAENADGIRYRYHLSSDTEDEWYEIGKKRVEKQKVYRELIPLRITVEGWTACGRLLTWELKLMLHKASHGIYPRSEPEPIPRQPKRLPKKALAPKNVLPTKKTAAPVLKHHRLPAAPQSEPQYRKKQQRYPQQQYQRSAPQQQKRYPPKYPPPRQQKQLPRQQQRYPSPQQQHQRLPPRYPPPHQQPQQAKYPHPQQQQRQRLPSRYPQRQQQRRIVPAPISRSNQLPSYMRRYTMANEASAKAEEPSIPSPPVEEKGPDFSKYIAGMAVGVFVLIIGIAILCGRFCSNTNESEDILDATKYRALH